MLDGDDPNQEASHVNLKKLLQEATSFSYFLLVTCQHPFIKFVMMRLSPTNSNLISFCLARCQLKNSGGGKGKASFFSALEIACEASGAKRGRHRAPSAATVTWKMETAQVSRATPSSDYDIEDTVISFCCTLIQIYCKTKQTHTHTHLRFRDA